VTIQRMDNVGVVVDDLKAAISFFVELGMELDGGTTPVEGDWVGRLVGLDDVRAVPTTPRPSWRSGRGNRNEDRRPRETPNVKRSTARTI
jgi:catechol 2,3-dioxygenase-like lactoylglutathione lyase family enzyme